MHLRSERTGKVSKTIQFMGDLMYMRYAEPLCTKKKYWYEQCITIPCNFR